MTFDELFAMKGFASNTEFASLVSSVKMDTAEEYEAFMKWRDEDGSKDGLLKLKFYEDKTYEFN